MAAICSVCLCSFKASGCGSVVLNCGHVYHRDCINQWLFRSDSRVIQRKECPSCRTLIERPRALKEIFLHFDSGDATLIGDDICQESPNRIKAGGKRLSNVELNAVETLQCQLESCQVALTESINVQNNLESENSQLKLDINAQKACINNQKAELQRFKLINEELRNRIRKTTEEINRFKSSKALLEVNGNEFQEKLKDYTESNTPEVALKTLATVLINMEKSLEKERKAVKTGNKVISALNLKTAQLNKKILDLEKERENWMSVCNETDYLDILSKCPVVSVERSKPPSMFSNPDVKKSSKDSRVKKLNSNVIDLSSEDDEDENLNSSGADTSYNASSIASRLNRRRTLPASPEIGNPMRKILKPRQNESDMMIRPSKMVFRVSKRNSIKLKPSGQKSNAVKK